MEEIKTVCPSCKREVIFKNFDFHKHGRQTKCPECNKKIILSRIPNGIYQRTARGTKESAIMARDRLSINCTTTKKEKDEILRIYKERNVNLAARVMDFLRADVAKEKKILEGEK